MATFLVVYVQLNDFVLLICQVKKFLSSSTPPNFHQELGSILLPPVNGVGARAVCCCYDVCG